MTFPHKGSCMQTTLFSPKKRLLSTSVLCLALCLALFPACNDTPNAHSASEGSTAGSTSQGMGGDATLGDLSVTDTGQGDSESQGAGETDGETDGASCDQAQFSFSFDAEPPNVMLVLDKSRSMTSSWDHDLDNATPYISRYHSLHNVVTYLVTTLGDDFNFGAQLFPAADAYLDEPTNDHSCVVSDQPEVAIAAASGLAILEALPAAADASISGGTPAVAGLRNAIEALQNIDNEGNRAVVLVTDGAANCNPDETADTTLFGYDTRVPEVLSEAYNELDIPVYVVGINILDVMGNKPAVNPLEALTEAATVGGVPAAGELPFYNAFNEIELGDALVEVLAAIECTINLEVEPDEASNVVVSVEGTSYEQVEQCDSQDGWVYSKPAGQLDTILLCGTACTSIQGGGTVEVEYLCPA